MIHWGTRWIGSIRGSVHSQKDQIFELKKEQCIRTHIISMACFTWIRDAPNLALFSPVSKAENMKNWVWNINSCLGKIAHVDWLIIARCFQACLQNQTKNKCYLFGKSPPTFINQSAFKETLIRQIWMLSAIRRQPLYRVNKDISIEESWNPHRLVLIWNEFWKDFCQSGYIDAWRRNQEQLLSRIRKYPSTIPLFNTLYF